MSSRRRGTRRRGCGICAASGRPSSPSKGITARSPPRRSAPTERMSSPRPMTRRRGCGICGQSRPSFVALEGHEAQVVSASFSGDGTHVVTASGDDTARVWDLRGDRPSFVALEGHQGRVTSRVVQPRRNACGHGVLRHARRGCGICAATAELRRPRRASGSVTSASFSADGTHVVTASDGQDGAGVGFAGRAAELRRPRRASGARSSPPRSAPTERMWSRRPMTTRRGCGICGANQPSFVALEGHRGRVVSASFSPDGTHVVTASDGQHGAGVGFAGRAGRASSPSKGIRVRSSPPRSAPTERMSSRRQMDNTARVWDLRGERPSFVALEGHQGRVYPRAFSADGTHVVHGVAGRDGAGVARVSGRQHAHRLVLRSPLALPEPSAARRLRLATEHPAEDRNFIPPPTADGRCPG